MQRINLERSDDVNAYEAVSDVMFTAFTNEDRDKLVFVSVNHTGEARSFDLALEESTGGKLENLKGYLTNEYEDLARQNRDLTPEDCVIPAHSVLTITADLSGVSPEDTSQNTAIDPFGKPQSNFKAYYHQKQDAIVVSFTGEPGYQHIRLYSITGTLMDQASIKPDQHHVTFPVSSYTNGVYLITAQGERQRATRKVLVSR